MTKIDIFKKCIKNGQKFNYKSKEYRFVQDCKIYDYSKDKLIRVEDFEVNFEEVVIQESDSIFGIVIGLIDDINRKPIPDIFICVSDKTNTNQYVVIRQNIYNDSSLKSMTFHMGWAWCNDGDITNSPSNILLSGFKSFYNDDCKGYALHTYIEDNTETILKCIPPRIKSVARSALIEMKQYYIDKKIKVEGIAESLKDLMVDYNFDNLYKRSHNIHYFDGVIDRNKYNDDGSICVSDKTYKTLVNMLGRKIKNVSIIRYQRDIDLNIEELKNISHIVVYDKSGKIYLIMFDDIN